MNCSNCGSEVEFCHSCNYMEISNVCGAKCEKPLCDVCVEQKRRSGTLIDE